MIDFPDPRQAPQDEDLIAISQFTLDGQLLTMNPDIEWPKQTRFGSTWDSEVLLEAYRRGLFPMPWEIEGINSAIGWWSPSERAVFVPAKTQASASTVRAAKAFRVSVDQAFDSVVRACGDPRRDHGWIDHNVEQAYCALHALGYAHSIEVWQSDVLVGGLYGVSLGGVFAGESMFHTVTNASKVAFHHLVTVLDDGQDRIIDAQWMTEHLRSLGAETMIRSTYCDSLEQLLSVPQARFGM